MTSSRQDLQLEELRVLLDYVLKTSYKAKDNDTKSEGVLLNCLQLFSKDYKFSVISNSNGKLCSHYPTKIVLLEYELSEADRARTDRVESLYDISKLKELLNKAKFARCRGRFAVPVILFEGKNICRGATISTGAEIYGRFSFDLFTGDGTAGGSVPQDAEGNSEEANEWQLFNRFRGQDVKLLKLLNIKYIQDLMVENKKVKFFMNVTSSEKVDKENRYSDFTIMSVPYPGCEFFREWRDNGYMAEGMLFDWSQGYVDAELDLPTGVQPPPPRGIDWTKYKSWDLVQLSQNYLRLMVHYLREGDGGMLVHCISGWDRTPLFVSLLRLSLWADGAVHQALGPLDILYLTIAYDWFLFGHNFPDRVKKGEEIFFFCFYFLKYITSEEYSVTKQRKGKRTASHTDSEFGGIDGVLLEEAELITPNSRGSNTSINSTSSLNSTKSSIDNAPIYFNVGSPEEDFTLSGNGGPGLHVTSSSSRASPQTRPVTVYSSTSPMAVPITRRLSEARNSSACGSWQIISGSGSVRGSTSSHGSPKSSASSSHNGASEPPSSSSESSVPEESARKQRLDAVRRIFLSVYTNLMDPHSSSSPDSMTSLTGILGNFAEKVGLKS